VQDLRFRAKVLLKDAKSAARWLRTTGDGCAPAASGIGGGVVVRAGWATMVANNATSAAAKFSVSALWRCQ
jgi:hypothetical protein